ncbi:MAG: NADH-quinone oxidoreductase subunit D [Aquificae bacterium]|nr:NADH-quinone oxidoreductase subunit D [Aquificota bacterium]
MNWINRASAERVKRAFGDKVSLFETKHTKGFRTDYESLKPLLKFLRDKERFVHFVDLTVVDFPERKERFEGLYILYNPDENERVIVKCDAKDGRLPSVVDLWAGAKWAEREAYDMFGVVFEGHENLRRMFMWEGYPYHPLRKDFPLGGIPEVELPSLTEVLHGRTDPPSHDFELMHTRLPTLEDLERTEKARLKKKAQLVLNWGPLHPGTHGTIWFLFDLEGEKVVQSDVILGQLHRGMEKIAENLYYFQFLPYTDRMDYISAICNELAYVETVERLLGVEVPPKARYIRTLFAELQRINSHLLWLGTGALDLGALTVFLYAFREREKIMDIIEGNAGYRLTTCFLRIGGVHYDLAEGTLDVVKAFIRDFPEKLKEYHRLLTRNRIWLRRTKDVGVIKREDVHNYGLSGPVARASGVPYDLRKLQPYAAYDEVEFDVPVGEVGDVYDRYLVRMEEMAQSVRIIEQCVSKLEKMPKSEPYINKEHPAVIPPKEDVYNALEDMVKSFRVVVHGESAPPGELYFSAENPRGELGFYILSKGGSSPYRLRIRSGALYNLSIFPKLIQGRTIADAIALLGSLDPVVGETDR